MGGCTVQFDPEFSASDADGDVLEYSILPVTDHASLFVLKDPSSLASISYKGQGISQDTNVTLLVKAQEKRTLDGRSTDAVVKIKVRTSVTTPLPDTTTTPLPDTTTTPLPDTTTTTPNPD